MKYRSLRVEELLTALGSGTHIRGEAELGGPFQCNAL